MKRIVPVLLFSLVLFCSWGFAFAQALPDVYIEEMVSGTGIAANSGFNGIIKSWISGSKLKQVAPGGQEVILYRADIGKVYMMNPARKVYIELPMEQMRMMTEKALEVYVPIKNGKIQVPDALYKKTGRTRKIGAWNTYEVEVLTPQAGPEMISTTKLWVSKDTGMSNDFVVRLFRITMGDKVSPEFQKLFEKMTDIDGYPVETITTATFDNQTFTTTKTVVKIDLKEKIDSSIFDVPSDYTKVEPPKPGSAQ
jgi:hypothetical protein